MASDTGFTVCKLEGTKNESFVTMKLGAGGFHGEEVDLATDELGWNDNFMV